MKFLFFLSTLILLLSFIQAEILINPYANKETKKAEIKEVKKVVGGKTEGQTPVQAELNQLEESQCVCSCECAIPICPPPPVTTPVPTLSPTQPPTPFPTLAPTHVPTIRIQTDHPTFAPTEPPTPFPTLAPTTAISSTGGSTPIASITEAPVWWSNNKKAKKNYNKFQK